MHSERAPEAFAWLFDSSSSGGAAKLGKLIVRVQDYGDHPFAAELASKL
jgi:hypothetical protein